jgi:hypothetical protein
MLVFIHQRENQRAINKLVALNTIDERISCVDLCFTAPQDSEPTIVSKFFSFLQEIPPQHQGGNDTMRAFYSSSIPYSSSNEEYIYHEGNADAADDDIFTEDEVDDTVSYISQGQTQPQGQQPLSPSILSPKSEKLIVGCTSKDIGSFYAALCSLGTKVNVGTKSKFDDYYEFEVNWSSNNYEQFTITRPLDEGVQPSFETKGYGDSFHHVRGESGTRVTITLFESLLPALSEEAIKAILHTIFETSQYRYAFSADDDSLLSSLKQQELAEAPSAPKNVVKPIAPKAPLAPKSAIKPITTEAPSAPKSAIKPITAEAPSAPIKPQGSGNPLRKPSRKPSKKPKTISTKNPSIKPSFRTTSRQVTSRTRQMVRIDCLFTKTSIANE